MGAGVARHFEMWRDDDISGVSGEGLVAEGWQYDEPLIVRLPDGSVLDLAPGWVVVRWKGKHQSTVFWPTFEDAVAVHGHGGATRFVWTGRTAPTEPCPVGEQVHEFDSRSTVLVEEQLRKPRGG